MSPFRGGGGSSKAEATLLFSRQKEGGKDLKSDQGTSGVEVVERRLPCSAVYSGSVKRTLRLPLCFSTETPGGGRPSNDALLRFRMETRPSRAELWRRNSEHKRRC